MDPEYAFVEQDAYAAYLEESQKLSTIPELAKPRNGESSEVDVMLVLANEITLVAGNPSWSLLKHV